MRYVQGKTQSKHKASAKTLVMRLFKDPLDDPKLSYVKDSVLGVKDSKPIVARSDPTMTELFELPALIVHGEFARIHIFPPRATPPAPQHARADTLHARATRAAKHAPGTRGKRAAAPGCSRLARATGDGGWGRRPSSPPRPLTYQFSQIVKARWSCSKRV